MDNKEFIITKQEERNMKHVEPLTKFQFLDKIYNYELNPYEWIYLGKIPAMVVFGSPASSFCKELEPALEIMGKRNKGKYNVFTVNTDQEKELAAIFTIDDIPTIYLCPMKGDPTIVKATINIQELTKLANKVLLPLY